MPVKKHLDCPYAYNTPEYEAWMRKLPDRIAKRKEIGKAYYQKNKELIYAKRLKQVAREKEARRLKKEATPLTPRQLHRKQLDEKWKAYITQVQQQLNVLRDQGIPEEELMMKRRRLLNSEKQERFQQRLADRAESGDKQAIHELWKRYSKEGKAWQLRQRELGLGTALVDLESTIPISEPITVETPPEKRRRFFAKLFS